MIAININELSHIIPSEEAYLIPWTQRATKIVRDYIELNNFEVNMARDKADFAALFERIGKVLTSYGLDMCDPLIRRTAVEGALFSATSYSHLPSMEAKVYIGVYTALIIQVDDTCESSVDVLDDAVNFSVDIVSGTPSRTPSLQALRDHISSCGDLLEPMAKPFLTFSTIQFVTACAIEVTPSLQETFSPEAACHTRSMSGDSLVYIIFIFPRSIPYKDYKDALPSICDFVDLANDLLSFYKEEIAGEECNLVSYLHKGCSNGATKVDVLEWVMQRASHCYHRSLELLKTKETREALRLFAQGMLEFHLQSKRYRLSEMGLGSRLDSL